MTIGIRYRNLQEALDELSRWTKDLNEFTKDNWDIIEQSKSSMNRELQERAKSPAFKMIEQVWNNSLETVQHSWERLNHSMSYAVELAIFSGMKFDEDDFDKISKQFRMGYWGDSGGFYIMAVKANNISACRALEKHMNLKPYIVKFGYTLTSYGRMGRSEVRRNSGRLAGRADFIWDGRRVTVTSIHNDYIIACSYKREWKETSGGKRYFDEKLEKRYRLTREQLIPKKEKPPTKG